MRDSPISNPAHRFVGNNTYGAKFDGIALFDGATDATIAFNYSHNNGHDGLLIDANIPRGI